MFAPAPMALLQESDQTWGYLLCVHSLTLKNRAVIVSARTSLSIDHGLRNNTEELLELILSSFNHSLDVCFLQCSLSHSLSLSFSISSNTFIHHLLLGLGVSFLFSIFNPTLFAQRSPKDPCMSTYVCTRSLLNRIG